VCLIFESAVVFFRPSSNTADADWPREPSSLARSAVAVEPFVPLIPKMAVTSLELQRTS